MADLSGDYRSVHGVLLAELLTALVLGAGGGWLRLPYDGLIALCALLACLFLALVALGRGGRVIRAVGVRRWAGWGQFVLALALQPLVWLALVSSFRLSDEHSTKARFERDRRHYDCIVKAVGARSWVRGHHQFEACGGIAQVDVTDQVRVELDWAGYFSNWEVIVYDPSESLRLVESPRVNFGPESLRSALGDFSIGYCRRLSGKYFFCGLG